jgi:hypothetical protein
MNTLEQYLKRATKGLYGSKKLEVQAELRGSIEARIWKLENRGKTSDEALATALLEMGAPATISAGLIKEHTMPKILKSMILTFVFAATSFTALNSSRAQIEVVTQPISGESVNTKPTACEQNLAMYYLSFSSIKENLEAAGVTVADTPAAPQEKSQTYSADTKPTLRFRLPTATKDLILQTAPGIDSPWKDDTGKLIFNPKPSQNVGNDRFYMSLWSFLHQLRNSGLPVRIEGWRNPSVIVGQTKLEIGSATTLVTPHQLYSSIAAQSAFQGLETYAWQTSCHAENHAIRVNAPVGTVYAVIVSADAPNDKTALFVDVARVGTDGILYFRTPHKILEFVKSRAAVLAGRAYFSTQGYGNAKHPAKTLLMRMNPDLTTTLELPAKTRSATIK